MKKILLYVLVSLFFLSCKKKEIALYSGPANIYFSTSTDPIQNWGLDSLAVSFTLTKNLQDSLVKIPVRATGNVVNTDRPYTVRIASNSTAKEGLNYDFLQKDFKIPAGKLTDSIRILLHRSADLKVNSVSLFFQLEANQNFVTNIQNSISATGKTISPTKFRLYSSDILQMPLSWYPYYLGDFSAEKFYLMLQVLNIDPVKFSGPAFSNVTAAEVQNYGIAMQRYLNSQKAAGKTVYEANGNEMVMGTGAQK
ncbi:DUF4843 domain-containing protein [Pedobacter sp.]|uniref:DUF4843 domain-containing protein n=1 Tax=Pedobacter sp. TaxID=1411316 RepID=UPI002C04BC4D|nr:DUF4843 domain-containing protein [Pedobacter sp.]HWW40214.1 DUF4843 domain-containing protein [Pedobacter sp.]